MATLDFPSPPPFLGYVVTFGSRQWAATSISPPAWTLLVNNGQPVSGAFIFTSVYTLVGETCPWQSFIFTKV